MLTNIGGSPLERFQAEAKRLNAQNRQEQQVKQPKEAAKPEKAQGGDRVSLGQTKTEGIGYDGTVRAAAFTANLALLRDLVARTFGEQGLATRIATEGGTIDLMTLTPEEAQDLIADDGYFGVDQTSERIVQFAIGLAGNDPSRIDAIRKGVEDGFAEAEKAWGGQLPEISYKTREAIMEKLDNWVAGFDGAV